MTEVTSVGVVEPGRVLFKLGRDSQGRLLALAFMIQDNEIIVLDAEIVQTRDEGWAWYQKVRIEQPWALRH
jgi:hypothetical protein